MAPVDSMKGTKLVVQIGDSADPEVFAAECMINSERGISFQSDTNEFITPDCENPDDPAWKEVTKDGLSATVSGAGLLHTTSTEAYFDWMVSDDAKNVRVVVGVLAAKGGGYFEGAFKLTAFEITGTRGDKAQTSQTLVSDGPVTWVGAAV